MFIRVRAEDIPAILEEHPKIIWLLHDETFFPSRHIGPSWHGNTFLNEFESLYPSIPFLESIVTEELDSLYELGFTKEMIWSKTYYRDFMISIEDSAVKDHTIGRCHCKETLVELAVDLFPELFEPPSVG